MADQFKALPVFKSLGFPEFKVHNSFNHFDFTRPNRRILVIGPMGSGKTEYSARVWRDSVVAKKKSEKLAVKTSRGGSDRREVVFVRSNLDAQRFKDYPDDALAYRGGYERLGENLVIISSSFELEEALAKHSHAGTWIIDEASFFDERLAYVVRNAAETQGHIFIFPTLILNFRKDIFNPTAKLLLEFSTDIFPLTAYCEHSDCIEDSFYTYRYYFVEEQECPALYFDPLIIIGGDTEKSNPLEPNYCTRCDRHHYLPGKEYTFLILKPMGEEAARGNIEPLKEELKRIKEDITRSSLFKHFSDKYNNGLRDLRINLNALLVPAIAEKALIYLYTEQNLISETVFLEIVDGLQLDMPYISKTLAENRRPLSDS